MIYRAFAAQTIQVKEEEWQRASLESSWAQHIYEAIDSQKWSMDRRLTGLKGTLALLEEWAVVTEELFDRVSFPKIKIRNPHQNWTLAMQ